MKTIALVAVLLAAGCTDLVTVGEIASAVEVCRSNAGLRMIRAGVTQVEVRCNNGAIFNVPTTAAMPKEGAKP